MEVPYSLTVLVSRPELLFLAGLYIFGRLPQVRVLLSLSTRLPFHLSLPACQSTSTFLYPRTSKAFRSLAHLHLSPQHTLTLFLTKSLTLQHPPTPIPTTIHNPNPNTSIDSLRVHRPKATALIRMVSTSSTSTSPIDQAVHNLTNGHAGVDVDVNVKKNDDARENDPIVVVGGSYAG